jgi:hypothetical protein
MAEDNLSKIERIRNRYMNYMEWNQNNIDEKMITVSGEYAFFQSIYYETSKKLTQADKIHDELWQGKYREYKFEYDMSLSPTEIKAFIEKDNDIIAKRVEVKKIKDFLDFITKCLENLSQLRWDMKHYIQWKQFQAGLS